MEFEKEKKMATREKNIWILIIFILSGLVIGGLLGQLASRSRFPLVVIVRARIWAFLQALLVLLLRFLFTEKYNKTECKE